MKTNEQFVITINRELGSGGRTVGALLADRLGVPFYDKALIKTLQQKYNLSTEEIERLKGRNHSWWADFKRAMSISCAMRQTYFKEELVNEPDLLITDDIFRSEQQILKGMADSESCVIAGRLGFYALREHPNHLSILITAPLEQRARRLMQKRGIAREEALQAISEVDGMRENYVRKYTGTSRYDAHNYDLVISMQDKTEEEVADLILRYIG